MTIGNGGKESDLDADLDRFINEVDEKKQEREADITSFSSRRETEDRSFIAKLIVMAFVASVLLFILGAGYVGLAGDCAGECAARWNNVSGQIIEVMKTLLLPVVTLVLGFYFGRQAGAAQQDK
jgi:hypothetical protein